MAGRDQDACLGEWSGRGKTIKIRSGDAGDFLVDMGPNVPTLMLVDTSGGGGWPKKWAVVRRPDGKGGQQNTVYTFELPSPSSRHLLVKKPSGDGVVEFDRVGGPPAPAPAPARQAPAAPAPPPDLDSPPAPAKGERRPPRSPSRSRSRPRSPRRSPRRRPSRSPRKANGASASFADSLARIVSERKVVHTDRQLQAAQWSDYESKLLDRGVEVFKQRCAKEAEAQRCSALISFENISKEIKGFPVRSLSGSTYHVGSWGKGVSAESWFYAVRGVQTLYEGQPVLFAEVLQQMIPKFVRRCDALGFSKCVHEAGTWKIHVTWPEPKDDDDKD